MKARSMSMWVVAGLAALVSFAGLAGGADAPKSSSGLGRLFARQPKWRLAVMTYTFNRFTLFDAIEKTRKLGCEYIEAFSWQKVSPKHGDMQFNPDMPEAAVKEVKAKLAENKVKLVGCYFQDVGKDEQTSRKVFEFCKKLGVQYIVSEPDPKSLPAVDKLAEKYKIKVAIHNHPKDPKNPAYTNWNPDNVMKMLEGRSKWMGCCADNGHWARSGLDGVECIRKYNGRLVSMHLKDVNKMGPDAHDVPYGTGVVDLKALLAEVKKQGVPGVFSIEYEYHMEDNMKDVAECITWFRQTEKALGVK